MEKAATLIQAHWRGARARTQIRQFHAAATTIPGPCQGLAAEGTVPEAVPLSAHPAAACARMAGQAAASAQQGVRTCTARLALVVHDPSCTCLQTGWTVLLSP